MSKIISILVTCRVQGNTNCLLPDMIDSLIKNSKDPDRLNVLIKFDDDDQGVQPMIKVLENKPIKIWWIREPRGRGYADIHIGFNRLLPHISQETELIGVMSDDFIAHPGWDALMLDKMETHQGQPYIIHQRPYPKEGVSFPIFERPQDVPAIDEAPFWSRELIFVTTWLGAGVAFTDGWTYALEHALWKNHRVFIGHLADKNYIERITDPKIDLQEGPRWNKERKENLNYMGTPYFRSIVENQAKSLALRIKCQS